MMKVKKLFFAAVLIFSLTGCCAYLDSVNKEAELFKSFEVKWDESVGTEHSDYKYGPGVYNNFDIYLPADIGSEKSRHLIMFTHGGGWTQGAKSDGNLFCKYFTSKGYVTATIDYTLSDGTYNPTISSLNEELVAAVEEIKNETERLGCPVVDMAVFGFSAGSCQNLLFAFKEKDRSALPVKFILDWSGPTSFNPDHWTAEAGTYPPLSEMVGLDGTNSGKASLVRKFSGEHCDAEMVANGSARSIWEAISPLTYVTDDIPPILVCYGVHDKIVPVLHQRLLLKKLREVGLEEGVDYDVIVFPNSGHALCCDGDKMDDFRRLADEYCERYF